jgi:hypothetical protein
MRNFIVGKNPPIQLTVRAHNTTLRVDKNSIKYTTSHGIDEKRSPQRGEEACTEQLAGSGPTHLRDLTCHGCVPAGQPARPLPPVLREGGEGQSGRHVVDSPRGGHHITLL